MPAITIILIIGIFIWFRITVTWNVVLAPLALINLIAFGIFIGVLLAPMSALYTDISKGLTVIIGFWLFLTPVIYPIPTEGLFGTIVSLNPVTPLLVTVRELATTGIVSNW